MVIIAYLKHSFVKHQTTSDISIFLKKRVTEKSMQKTDQKLTNDMSEFHPPWHMYQ